MTWPVIADESPVWNQDEQMVLTLETLFGGDATFVPFVSLNPSAKLHLAQRALLRTQPIPSTSFFRMTQQNSRFFCVD